ncbi:inositol monophosphatase family protein [Arthrobacter psychrochitiniphilus]|uniref:Inositol monophosphatase n=1 Tax=Arthrobacter psychrochitiniphilus TaxID=291045 RepID=A0A2V3DVN2_9MICC|nr:inositol monophosphatase family protein [Arthrobacter psychrochitiniphilus]NYG16698.1 myo-inositol-1(or 4)-monophosphatase [Arthrobacter psychrochitiniphilus]PXA69193.1 inositol monophosphatase [Arthrobacter psychrochitiniphilus]
MNVHPVPVDELLEVALRAAAAGAAVLAARDPAGFGATEKSSDADWVTAFDVAAENAVRAVIAQARPHDVITGEELAPALPETPSGYRWSIDPLDGTMNFIRNIAYYGTSVAVMGPSGEWLAGVVNAPALRRVYFGSRGEGAWLDEKRADGAQSVRRLSGPVEKRGGTLISTALTYDPVVRRRLVSELDFKMDHFGDFRRLGSAALELCAVAEGSVDAYLEYGLFEHDFAAGGLIAEEAGAWVHLPALSPAINGLPTREEVLSVWTGACVPGLQGGFAPEQ